MQITDMLDPTKLTGGLSNTGRLQDMQRLTDQIAAGKREQVGQEFEAIFTSMLLKQMRETLSEGLFGEDHGDVYGGLFDMFLGQHMAKAGAIGIDQVVDKYLQSVEGGGE